MPEKQGDTQAAATCATDQSAADTDRKKRRWRVRWAVRIGVILLVIGYLKFVGLDSKFYYPDDTVYLRPADLGLVHEDVRFRTRDGLRLHGWFLPAQHAAKGLVVHFHGNAANVTNHLPLVSWLPEAGYHVLMFDYRGYGESEGSPTRAGTILDGHAALDYAKTRPEAEGLPLLFYGQSLGGAVAIVVAAERPEVAAVVAESTFSSYRRIAARHARGLVVFDWAARLLVTATISAGHDPLDVIDQIAPRPLLIVAAENDRICFPELARELYVAAGEPKAWWLAPRAEHLAILDKHGPKLIEQVLACFEKAPTLQP